VQYVLALFYLAINISTEDKEVAYDIEVLLLYTDNDLAEATNTTGLNI